MIIRIAYNYDTGTKLENSYKCIKRFSLVSAWILKCPSSAQLGTFSALQAVTRLICNQNQMNTLKRVYRIKSNAFKKVLAHFYHIHY